MPVNWDQKYKAEYDYAKKALAKAEDFDPDWQKLVRRLHTLMEDGGPSAAEADALQLLRRKVLQGDKALVGHKAIAMDQGILQAVKGWSKTNAATVAELPKMRAAALKLLCHLHMIKRSGNRIVWVQAVPTEFHAWPTDDLFDRGATTEAVRVLLRAHTEHFSHEDRKHLSDASVHGLAWCQKTLMVLASAATAGSSARPSAGDVAARNLVKRWFADPSTSEAELDRFIQKLSDGFKKIVAKFTRGKLILTDWVPLRTMADAEERSWIASEAFTFRSEFEGMDVVYIESNFFKHNTGNVLKGRKNWTRILVHELTHLAVGTEDVNIGNARYAWYGIGPHAGFPGSAAIRNADSWAFFCADCSGSLTQGERNHALKII